MKLSIISLFALCLFLGGCDLNPTPGEKIIKSVGDCETVAGMQFCTVTFEDGTSGKIDKFMAQPGAPVRKGVDGRYGQ